MRIRIAVAAASIILAGCGNPEATSPAVSSPASPPARSAPEVTIKVSGAYSGTFESTGSIYCGKESPNAPEGFELYAMKSPEQFNLRMPRKTAPGTYAVSDGAEFDFYYTDPKRVKYAEIQSATVTLQSVPQAQGERLVGTINAALQSRDGAAVNVDIQLDLDAGYQSFDECS